MELKFKDETELKLFKDNCVDCMSALDHASPQFVETRKFIKTLYDSAK